MIATVTYQGVRIADTAVITVTNVAPASPPDHLVILAQAGEDFTLDIPTFASFIYLSNGKTLNIEARDADNSVIPEAIIAVATSAPTMATFPTSTVNPSGPVEIDFDQEQSRPGPVTIYADATVYGVTLRDTAVLALKNPYLGIIEIHKDTISAPGATPVQTAYSRVPLGDITISAGGLVWWLNISTDSVDIVFDTPGAATEDFNFLDTGGGDIPAFPGCPNFLGSCINVASRQFLTAGTVQYHSVKTGLAGTIIVQ